MSKKIEISNKTIFFIAGFLASIWALYQIREVIIILFVALIFMSAMFPLVESLEKLKVPKVLSIAIVYIVVVATIIGLVSIGVTPLAEQTNNLTLTLPQTISKALPPYIDQGVLQQQVANFSHNIFSVTLTIFSEVVALISVAVLTFYLLLERENLDHLIAQFFIGHEEKAKRVVRRIEEKLGAWLRGQIILSLIIGTAAFIILTILGVPYALPLAIIAGLMEVVPVIGPIISSLPAIAVAYLTSPFLALLTGIAFFIIQQLENHIIVPQLMKRAVGLNPLIVILAVSIGGKLLGISGALLAVPVTVVIQIAMDEFLTGERKDIV